VTRFGSRGECEARKQGGLDAWRWIAWGYAAEGNTVGVLLEGMEAGFRYVCLPHGVDPRRRPAGGTARTLLPSEAGRVELLQGDASEKAEGLHDHVASLLHLLRIDVA